MTVYTCRNRRCKEYGKEFKAMNIEDVKIATGNRVHCDKCGQLAWFVRREPNK